MAEDSEDDLLLLQLAFEKAGFSHKLVHAWNGQEALKYLAGDTPFWDNGQHQSPDLILCDLKMPCLDGFGLLSLLKSDPKLSALPVVVLSSSDLEEDVQRAKCLGAREFLTKPAGLAEYKDLVAGLRQRWLRDGVRSVPKTGKSARVLLRNLQTGAFFQSVTRWTEDQNEALNFQDHDTALRVARELRLENIEVLRIGEDGEPRFGAKIEIDP